MKLSIYSLILPFLIIFVDRVSAQHPAWQNIVNTEDVLCFAEDGSTWWIGTQYAGLIKYDVVTAEKKLFDKTNTPLKSSTITAIAIDKNGLKWVGTESDGLYTFDGTVWTQIKINNLIPGPKITELFIDDEGILWMGADGLYKYNGTLWTNEKASPFGLPSNEISSITKDKNGILWVGSGNRIASNDGSSWKNYTGANVGLSFAKINDIHVDDKNVKWFATPSGLLKFDNTNWTNYTRSNSKLPTNDVLSIESSKDGKVWISARPGVVSFDGTEWKTFPIQNAKGIELISQGLYFLNNEKLASRTSDCIYLFNGNSWDKKEIAFNPLLTTYQGDIVIDNDDTKWIYDSGKLIKIDSLGSETYDFPESLTLGSNAVLSVDQNGTVWIGYNSGIVSFDKNKVIKTYGPSQDGILIINIQAIAFDRNNHLWASTLSEGVVKYDGTKWTSISIPNLSFPSYVLSITIDEDNKKWFGTTKGLMVFDDLTWTVYNTSNSNIPENSVRDIIILSKNDIVVATANKITKFDGVNWTTLPDAFPFSFASNNQIHSDSKNNIWVASDNGLVLYDKDGQITRYTPENSPILGRVRRIGIDKLNKIWALNDYGGISVYNPDFSVSTIENMGTNILENRDNIYIYPNPSSDFIQFTIDKKVDLSICNATGNVLIRKDLNPGDKIDISNIRQGLYFASITTHDGIMKTIPFVKK